MAQRIIMIILILVIVLGGGFYAYKELMPPVQQETGAPVYSTKEVVRGNILVGLETSGGLEPSQQSGIRVPGARSGGTEGIQYNILEYLVKEGEAVRAGQPIVKLDSMGVESKIKEKQEELDTKKKQLAEICQVPVEQLDSLNPAGGITITAPVDGRITELDVEEGKELELGHLIARIVDNSTYKIEAKLTTQEFELVKEGQKMIVSFPYFDGTCEGVITRVNSNAVPYSNKEDKENKENFAESFVHSVIIEGKNQGLIQRGMEAEVGIANGDGSTRYFMNKAVVKGFVKDESVLNTIEAVVTKVHVDNMQKIRKGDPIVTMASSDIQDMVEEKLKEIRELKAALNELLAQREMLEIKAPMEGVIADFHRAVGESVGPGEWIGYLYTVSDMLMWAMVDDIDIVNIKQGAKVKVTIDAAQGKTFNGEVTFVSTVAESSDSGGKFRIEIKVEGSPEMRPGMQAKAYIDAGSAENVLLVPIEALFEESGKTMVEILKPDGTTSVVPLKLGLINDKVAEVKEGLKEGDMVVTGSTADLLPSQHIKSEGALLPDSGKGDKDNSQDQQNEKK